MSGAKEEGEVVVKRRREWREETERRERREERESNEKRRNKDYNITVINQCWGK